MNISNQAKPKHLLWTLIFLKVNKLEPVHCQLGGCKSQDTYRQWVKRFADGIAKLEGKVIIFENRFKKWNGKTQCLICIDGTDVPINEPGDRSSIWWSHKFNGPGLRYKVATCIATSDIVWFCGPFPCNYNNRNIFDLFLSKKLIPGEGVKANSGYSGRPQVFMPGVAKNSVQRKEKSWICGRHENMNGRLKVFGVMKQWENSDVALHGVYARCVAIIVQLSFNLGEKLYNVPYTANYD